MAAGDRENPLRRGGLAAAVLTLRFATELMLVGVLAYVGANVSASLASRIILAIALPLAAALIWGLLLAPRARRRLADPLRLGVEVVLFLTPVPGLISEGVTIAIPVCLVLAIGTAFWVRAVVPGG